MHRHTRLIPALAVLVFGAGCGDERLGPTDPAGDIPTGVTTRIAAPFTPGTAVSAARSGRAALAFGAASTDCTFTTEGTTMVLDSDCMTDATIFIPNGWTLDGDDHTITAVDPAGGHFTGAVIQNAGTVAHVREVTVTASGLANVCDAGANRLRGIMFAGASGTIEGNTVLQINQGASGCQEGNAIEVRNAPFDGTHPNTQTVAIVDNTVDDYQKTGIVANGDVDVEIADNELGASATQANLAANGIQVGFGGIARVEDNELDGNQWLGVSNFAASAILIFAADGAVEVEDNEVGGNSDVGLFVVSDNGLYRDNEIEDKGPDGPHGDFGLADLGTGNVFDENEVCGFDTPFFPAALAATNEACEVDDDGEEEEDG